VEGLRAEADIERRRQLVTARGSVLGRLDRALTEAPDALTMRPILRNNRGKVAPAPDGS
jgi:hypothetical protein